MQMKICKAKTYKMVSNFSNVWAKIFWKTSASKINEVSMDRMILNKEELRKLCEWKRMRWAELKILLTRTGKHFGESHWERRATEKIILQ
jgi:hypothetical protein